MKSYLKHEKKIIFFLLICSLILFFGFPTISEVSFQENYIPGMTTAEGCVYSVLDSIRFINFISSNSDFHLNNSYNLNSYFAKECFFKIVGNDPAYFNMTQDTDLKISVGFPFVFSFIFQLLVFTLLLKFLTDSKFIKPSIKYAFMTSFVGLIAYIISFNNNEFLSRSTQLDLIGNRSKFLFLMGLIIFGFIINFSIDHKSIIYFLPFSIIFGGLLYGLSINLWLLSFAFLGVFNNYKLYMKFNIVYVLFSSVWLFNFSYYGYFDQDRVRSLIDNSETPINYLLVLIFLWMAFNGLIYLSKLSSDINLSKLKNKFLNAGFLTSIFGLLATIIPVFSVLSQVIFLNQRPSMTSIEPTRYGSWRGAYSSAESLGEIYFLILVIFLTIHLVKKDKLNAYELLKIVFILLGLYLTSAASSILLLIAFLTYSFSKENIMIRKFFMFFTIFIIFIVALVPLSSDNLKILENINLVSEKSQSNQIFYKLNEDIYSTTFNTLKKLPSNLKNNIRLLSDVINREQVWGLAVSKYNPDIQKVAFGSGVGRTDSFFLNNVNNSKQFILPHSSLFALYMYVGLFGIISLLLTLIFQIKNDFNLSLQAIIILMLINWIKTDSIFYIGNLFYFYLLIGVLPKLIKNKTV